MLLKEKEAEEGQSKGGLQKYLEENKDEDEVDNEDVFPCKSRSLPLEGSSPNLN